MTTDTCTSELIPGEVSCSLPPDHTGWHKARLDEFDGEATWL